MKPEEKARELVERFLDYADWDCEGIKHIGMQNSKQCALICVEEILKCKFTVNDWRGNEPPEYHKTDYWQQVKQEIEKI